MQFSNSQVISSFGVIAIVALTVGYNADLDDFSSQATLISYLMNSGSYAPGWA